MPTTKEETLYIAKIFDEIIKDSNIVLCYNEYKKRLTQELAEKVGYLTINYSVRKSLFDLCKHYNPDWKVSDEIINKLIKDWYDKKENQSVSINEFVGLSYEEWEDYIRRHSLIYW